MGETNALLQRNRVRSFVIMKVFIFLNLFICMIGKIGCFIISYWKFYCLWTKPAPQERNCPGNRSNLWFNVCSRRRHHPCNVPGELCGIPGKISLIYSSCHPCLFLLSYDAKKIISKILHVWLNLIQTRLVNPSIYICQSVYKMLAINKFNKRLSLLLLSIKIFVLQVGSPLERETVFVN